MGDFASMHETEHNTQRTKEKKVEIAEGGIVLGAPLKLPVRNKPQYSRNTCEHKSKVRPLWR